MFEARSAFNLATCCLPLQIIARRASDKHNFIILQGFRGRRSSVNAGLSDLKAPEHQIPSRSFRFIPEATYDKMSVQGLSECIVAMGEVAGELGFKIRFSLPDDGTAKIDLIDY